MDGAGREGGGDVFERRRGDHGRLLQALVATEVDKRAWTLVQFAAERERRLRDLVAHAKEHSPWHAERLAAVEPGDVTEASFRSLPTMTKTDLMSNWDVIVCDRRVTLAMAEQALEESRRGDVRYLFDEYQVVASGGSSGTRGVFLWDFEGLARGVALARRFQRWVGAEVGPVTPVRTAYVQATNPGHMSHLVARCFGDPTLPSLHLSPARPLTELVAQLNGFEPTQLVGYPSSIHTLAEEALAGRLRVRLQRVGCQAEPLLDSTRSLISDAFGAPITDLYGASECLNLAQGWPGEDFLRLTEDNAVVEPISADGSPAPIGEPGDSLLVTNLLNRVLPLVRYELNDELTFLPGADDGRPGRPVRVSGRRDDTFRYGATVLHPHVLRSILGARDISEYQVRQTTTGVDVAVRCTDAVDLGGLARRIGAALEGAGLQHPIVHVERADTLRRHERTGKLTRFVPL